MKLSKNTLIATLALNGAVGCTINQGVPAECDSVGKLENGTQVLDTKAQVEAHCKNDLVQEDTRQAILTCVYDLALVGPDQYDLLTVETNCHSHTLEEDLGYVFDKERENDVRYCVSNDQDLYCE